MVNAVQMTSETLAYATLGGLAIALLVSIYTDIRYRLIFNKINIVIAIGAPLFWLASGGFNLTDISLARIVGRIPERAHDARRRKGRTFAGHYDGAVDPFHSADTVHRYYRASRLFDWRRVFETVNGAAWRRPLQPKCTVCSMAPKMLWPASSRTSIRTTSPSCRNGVVISPVAIFSTMRTSARQL